MRVTPSSSTACAKGEGDQKYLGDVVKKLKLKQGKTAQPIQ
jgi:hypothetical protein